MNITSKIVIQFTLLTFFIAYLIAVMLIFGGNFGYSVHNWVDNIQQFFMNIPFSIYILSPAIACYIILRKNNVILRPQDWIKTVFYLKNNPLLYLYVFFILILYFGLHVLISGNFILSMPFYTILLSLPGALIIGGLEEAGWMYVLQPFLYKKYGFLRSSLQVGFIWFLWHIPLFFIPGTNHGDGHINFWMFTIQLFSFRFVHGALYTISGKGYIFMSVLFHTLFNASSPVFGTTTMNWTGTIIVNTLLILISIVTVYWYQKTKKSDKTAAFTQKHS
ncbi:CPBP family intramembrane glutamic endopeptidase [Enterococcus sp. LJL128]